MRTPDDAAVHARRAAARLPLLVRVLLLYVVVLPLGAGLALVTTESRRIDGLVLAATVVASSVLWLRWFWAAYGVVVALGRNRHWRFWAVLGWLLPVFSWFVPKRLANDMWWVTGRSPLPRLLQTWWAANIALFFSGVLVEVLGVVGYVALLVLLVTEAVLTARVAQLLTPHLAAAAGVPVEESARWAAGV